MLYYNRTGLSGVIEVSKASQCDTCQYWYFWIKGLNFNLMPAENVMMILMILIILMTYMNLGNITILNNGISYHCVFNGISKSETKNLMQNIYLSGKNGTL